MRILLVIGLCILNSCSYCHIETDHYRVYRIYDMDEVLQDYYTNELGKINPGLACGDFKRDNNVGCFKLLVNAKHGKVEKLIYHDFSGGEQFELYNFSPPVNYVLIEKIYDNVLATSDVLQKSEKVILEAGQPSLRLVFSGKSAVVFYWKNGAFHKIWTSD